MTFRKLLAFGLTLTMAFVFMPLTLANAARNSYKSGGFWLTVTAVVKTATALATSTHTATPSYAITQTATPALDITSTLAPTLITPLSPTVTIPQPTRASRGYPVLSLSNQIFAMPTGPGQDGLVDIYFPSSGTGFPVVLLFPGLGYDKSSIELLARDVTAQGAVVYVPDWPYSSSLDYLAQNGRKARLTMEQVSCAFQYARATSAIFRGNENRIFAVGFSGGGTIIVPVALIGDDLQPMWEALKAQRGSPAQQMICAFPASAAVYGLVTISGYHTLWETDIGVAIDLKSRDQGLYDILSPFANLGKNLGMRILISHSRTDPIVPFSASSNLYKQLVLKGYDATFYDFYGGHVLPTNDEVFMQLLRDFLFGG